MSTATAESGVDQEGVPLRSTNQQQEPEPQHMESVAAGSDGWAIAAVRALRHRVGTRHSCHCEDCRAIVRVTTLATERLAMSQRKGKRRDHERSEILQVLLSLIPSPTMDGIIDKLDREQCDMLRRVFDGYARAKDHDSTSVVLAVDKGAQLPPSRSTPDSALTPTISAPPTEQADGN